MVGLGSCTDKIIFIDKPIKEHAFDSASEFKSYEERTIYLVEGCTSIGDQAFRKCNGLRNVVFLQSHLPFIGNDIFGYTWDHPYFKVFVPNSLFDEYKDVNDTTWQQYIVKANKLNFID